MLVIDVGSVTTRAMLFDVVDGRYRFLASGSSPSTVGAPFHDISEGVHQAINQLQTISGRALLGEDEQIIIPENEAGGGVDLFAATISAGPPLKLVVMGLLEDVSLESARRLATTTYSGLLETISLNDRRKTEARIDTVVHLRPDLILVAGGTEGGASQSVLKLLESVGLACYLIPEKQRPELLFAGNQELHEEVRGSIGSLVNLHFAPNVRPSLETEQLQPAQAMLADITAQIRTGQISGVGELDQWAKGGLLPSAAAFGRLIRFLSKSYDSNKGVLGVDVGASATTLAAAFDGDLVLGVYPELGLGASQAQLLDHVPLTEVARWLPVEISDEIVREHLANKALYPASIPASPEALAIEQSVARQLMQVAVKKISTGFPLSARSSGAGLLPWFEPIVATGSVLTRAPSLAHTMLMLLDGLQPTGVTTIALDQNHLSAALGAAAAANPILPVQVLDSSTFLYLGAVISPVGRARPGTPILRLKMINETNGHETSVDVKQGTIEVLPLPLGQSARLQMQPLHRFDVGMGGPGRGDKFRVYGGAMGVVIDARGRPLQLPKEPARRYESFKKWLWTLGG
jgi:hypothetical protein